VNRVSLINENMPEENAGTTETTVAETLATKVKKKSKD